MEELCKNARRVAVLEGIVDSTNVGAIFRSAAALNMDAVLITPSCCDPLSRRAVRVSMGTVFQVPWAQVALIRAAAVSQRKQEIAEVEAYNASVLQVQSAAQAEQSGYRDGIYEGSAYGFGL